MMGERLVMQDSLFYEFHLEEHVPGSIICCEDRSLCRSADLTDVILAAFYSPIGRPSMDPELMMRMLIVGYCYGIRSERRLCEEVHLNLAYRWFCRLGPGGRRCRIIRPSRRTAMAAFSESDVFRHLFERVVERCIAEGLVGGRGFRGRRQPDRGRCQPPAFGPRVGLEQGAELRDRLSVCPGIPGNAR